ncbi:OBG GTPase family GTP-binding protein [Nanoarchaeota archaeon]
MVSTPEKIKELEDLIKNSAYNKRTQHAIGQYKAQLAKLKEKQSSRGKGQKKGEGYTVRKSGNATAVLLGFPSVGKSTLLNKLTDQKSPVGAYAFTTLTVIPGTLKHKHAEVQILDVPGIVHGAASGKGRGKEVLSAMRNADLVIILIDVNHPAHLKVLQKEVNEAHIRMNQELPIVKIKKTGKGGIKIGATVKLDLTKKTIENVCREFGLVNADIVIREKIDIDQLIDVIEKNKHYIPAITILTKIDMVSKEKLSQIKRNVKPDLMVSAEKDIGIKQLKELIHKRLGFISVYCKEVGKKADMKVPLIIQKGDDLRAMCNKLHREFADKFKFARIWGKSVKFDGQKILKLYHKLKDGDIVEIHLR